MNEIDQPHSLLNDQDLFSDSPGSTLNQLTISPDQSIELLENISEAFYGLDHNWCFIYLNHKAEQLWGKRREELIGKQIWAEFPESINTQAYHELHRAVAEQQTIRFETFSSFFNAWVEVEVYPTRIGLSVYFHDITGRKQAENALAQSQQQLRLITDSLPALISYIDPQLRYQFANQGYEAWFGLKPDQIIGRLVVDIIGSAAFEAFKPDLEIALKGRKVDYEQEMPFATGTRYTRIQLLPHILEDGTVVGVITMQEDIGERKQADEGLARLAAIVTSSNDAIITKTLTGMITSWNQGAERIFGYTADEVIQKPITIIFPPDRIEEENVFQQKIAQGETVKNYDTIRRRKDGSEIFVSVSLSPLKDGQGNIIGFSKILQDITDRKRVEAKIYELNEHLEQLVEARTAELQEINRDLDSFAYVISHDLKAPLRGITQLASWLSTDYADSLDDEGRKMLRLMIGRARRMHEMIEGILQYSRIGRLTDNPTRIDLNELVAGVIDLLGPADTIAIIVAPDLPVIYGDEMRIQQIFQNLIGNAIKYQDKAAGQIAVTWEDQSTHWQFAIADNGPGIPAQYHDKIFQIFQTLAPRDQAENTGIGLALVKKVVELYDGRVWLESIEGKGSIFYFTLPKNTEGR